MKIGSSIVILGKKRTGKTYLMRHFLLPRLVKAYDIVYVFDVTHSFKDLTGKKKVIVDYPHSSNYQSEINQFCKRILSENKGKRKMLVADEIHLYVNNSNLESIPNLQFLVTVGGNYNTGYCMATQRPASMNKTLLSEADTAFLFRMDSGRDKQMLRENFPQKVAETVPKLNGHEFIMYGANQGFLKSELKGKKH